VSGGWAATTVSATMMAAHAAGIAVFATGGIGGVHRGAYGGPSIGGAPIRPTLDVSSDLEELARTPVAVVCAGPKAILDLPLTLEFLETRGVPVVAVGQDDIPGFYARHSRVPAPVSVPDVDAAAALLRTHLDLGERPGLLVCVPVPASAALDTDIVTEVVERAVGEAETALVRGPALTPWLLARIGELTGGASIRANTALIVNDARVAGQLALALAVPPPADDDGAVRAIRLPGPARAG
jgi:pseudouridine-5'-phosphate glycosidase